MALPFLPGNCFDKNLGKSNFHKSHHLDYRGNVSYLYGDDKTGIGGETLPGQRIEAPFSRFPPGRGRDLPAWVAFDKQVLAFDAYFQEAVTESRLEQYRVRPVKVYFYLEDDSIQIVEPRLPNAGINQGTLTRRQRLQKPPPDDHLFYRVEDLNVGVELYVHGRVLKLTNCDEFTKQFLRKLGICVEKAIQIPADPYMDSRKAMQEMMQPLRPYDSMDTLKQYLDHDRHVLRFYCYWDDRESVHGEIRYFKLFREHTNELETSNRNCVLLAAIVHFARMRILALWFPVHVCRNGTGNSTHPALPREQVVAKDLDRNVLHYFLADDTVEIHEIRAKNSGRDDTSVFLSRQRLPKAVEQLPKPGDVTKKTVLKVYGTIVDGYYLNDRLQMGAVQQDFYKDCDLMIGTILNVFNRKFVIYDCDCFTKEYYRVKYDLTNFTPIEPVRDVTEDKPELQLPPYNGFGSEEDSLANCLRVVPKPPQRDFVKFMAHDRKGLDGKVVRFHAKLVTDVAVDKDRRFIISFFRTDDTLTIYEPPERNSGFKGGKFLERCRVKKPNQPRYPVEFSKYYTLCDMYVGAVLDVNKWKFLIVDADEYAYNYLENHLHEFPQSDVCTSLGKLKQILEAQRAHLDYSQLEQTSVPFDEFSQLIKSLTGCCDKDYIRDHDIVTLARCYQVAKEPQSNFKALLAVAQDQIRRANWDGFEHIEEQCIHHDGVRCGLLEPSVVRSVFKALHVPVNDDLLRALLAAVSRNEDGLIDYRRLAQLVNWQCNPVAPPRPDPAHCFEQRTKGSVIRNVNVDAIRRDIEICRPIVPHPCDVERQESGEEIFDRERDVLRHDDHHFQQ